MTHGLEIVYDLENVPLEIETNSELGSDEFLAVRFFMSNMYAGGFEIIFSCDPPQYYPQYYLQLCTHRWLDFLMPLPCDTKKIWKITLERGGAPRLKVHCNGMLVVDQSVSAYECFYPNWLTWWMNNVTHLLFYTDTNATYYKHPCKGDQCILDELQYPISVV